MTDLEWDKAWDHLEKQISDANARIISLGTEVVELRKVCKKLKNAVKADINVGRLVSRYVGKAVDEAEKVLNHE